MDDKSFVIKVLALARASMVITSWLSFFASVWLMIYFVDWKFLAAAFFWGILTAAIWTGGR